MLAHIDICIRSIMPATALVYTSRLLELATEFKPQLLVVCICGQARCVPKKILSSLHLQVSGVNEAQNEFIPAFISARLIGLYS